MAGAFVGYLVARQEPQALPSSVDHDKTSRKTDEEDVERALKLSVSHDRLDVATVMTELANKHEENPQVKERGIGVWVSGPTSLIRAVELEGAGHGGIFDVHYEEFEW